MVKLKNVEAQTINAANSNNTLFPFFKDTFKRFDEQERLRNAAILKREEVLGKKGHSFSLKYDSSFIKSMCESIEHDVNRYFPKTMREGAIGRIGFLMEAANIAGIWSSVKDDDWDEVVAETEVEEETQEQK